MGIFNRIIDFFKQEIELNRKYYKEIQSEGKTIQPEYSKLEDAFPEELYTVYCFGHLFRIFPVPSWPYSNHIDLICASDTLISEDVQYDLTQKESILSIAVPGYDIHAKNRIDEDLGVASSLEFALRAKGDKYWDIKNYDLAIACYGKATQLMAVSDEYWEDEDLYLIVRKLEELGRTAHADKWRVWLDRNCFSVDEESYINDIGLLRKLDPKVEKDKKQEEKKKPKEERKNHTFLQAVQCIKKKDELSVIYSRGHITQIVPEPTFGKGYYDILDQIRAVTSIISDRKHYDLTNVRSIYSICVSAYSRPENDYHLGPYGTIEYLLQEKGNSYSKWTQKELGVACLRKAIELMKISDVEWDRRDFQRIAWRLKEFGEEEDANKLEKWYKENVLTDEQESELILAGKIDKELSSVQKEIIMVKRITTEDMLQFTGMPYRFDSPIQKHIEHGSHPSAYMDLSPFNQEVAKSDLSRLNKIIKSMASDLPYFTSKFFLQVDKVVFSEYDSSYGYSTLVCTPHTFTGKISKFPLTLSFMTRMDIRTYSAIGQLLYNKSGVLERATVNVWRAPSDYSCPGTGWGFSFGTFDSSFILCTAETTLIPDEYGRATIVYRCSQIIEEENKRALNRAIFEWMQKHLPDDCPKSISGFSRMRNANSKNYQALVKKAEAAGFVIPQTLEDVENWPENQ